MRKRGAMATEQLSRAYMTLFQSEAGRLVLADLAEFSGFFKVIPSGTTPDQAMYCEGMRNVFGRILHYMQPTSEQMFKLSQIAAAEARVTSLQGDYLSFDQIDATEIN